MIPKELCTGCSTCAMVCDLNSIVMKENSEGFYYPEINNNTCVHCGKCERACPVQQSFSREMKNDCQIAFAAQMRDDAIRRQSSSGGVFPLLAEYIFEKDGVVYGAAFDEDFKVKHIGIDSAQYLYKLQGSKYVQSDLGSCFWEIEEYLKKGREVLFSGTPCQVAGLKSYLRKSYLNLTTVEFVCHGVPSPLAWREYKKQQVGEYNSSICNVSFRDKSSGWKDFSIRIIFDNDDVYKEKVTEDSYMKAFLNNISLRNSCYNCVFKSLERNSDFTLADLWGIENIVPEMDDDGGTSLVWVQSDKGKRIFEEIGDKIQLRKIDANLAVQYNPSALKSCYKHNFREYFFHNLGNKSFDKLVGECLNPSYFVRFQRKLLQIKHNEEETISD